MRGALTPCFTFAGTAPLAARVAAAAVAAVAAAASPQLAACVLATLAAFWLEDRLTRRPRDQLLGG